MSKAKILIVEDEGLTAFALQRKLRKWGYEVPTFTVSGKDAVQKVNKIKPDLVLLDINLKGELDGLDAAEEIIKEQEVPIIFTTAYDDEKMLDRAYSIGASGYITKPYEEKELKENIQNVLHDKIEENIESNIPEDIEKPEVLDNKENEESIVENIGENELNAKIKGTDIETAVNEFTEEMGSLLEEVIEVEVKNASEEDADEKEPPKTDTVKEAVNMVQNENMNLKSDPISERMDDVLDALHRRYNIIESHVVQSNGQILYSSMPNMEQNRLNETLDLIASSKKVSESRDNNLERIFFIGDKMQTLITLSPDIALIFSLEPDANIGMVSLVMKNAFNEINGILNN